MVPEEETVLRLRVRVRELDWSDFRNYMVFENALDPNLLLAEGWVDIDLTNPQPVTFTSEDVDVVFDPTVVQFDFDSPFNAH